MGIEEEIRDFRLVEVIDMLKNIYMSKRILKLVKIFNIRNYLIWIYLKLNYFRRMQDIDDFCYGKSLGGGYSFMGRDRYIIKAGLEFDNFFFKSNFF